MKRARLTKKEFAAMWLAQEGRCGCGCGERLVKGEVDAEHSTPVALLGDPKPDSLWRRDCHKMKTKGDVRRIAKAERQGGRKGQWARRLKNGPQIQSRGFDKTKSRGFDGKVRERNSDRRMK